MLGVLIHCSSVLRLLGFLNPKPLGFQLVGGTRVAEFIELRMTGPRDFEFPALCLNSGLRDVVSEASGFGIWGFSIWSLMLRVAGFRVAELRVPGLGFCGFRF